MAMNLGMKTPKLYFKISEYSGLTNNIYENGIKADGTWDTAVSSTVATEEQYLDLGIVLNEREEVTIGGIAFSLTGTGVNDRVFWAVGGKILRVSISGIIPDGIYVATDGSTRFNGKSNASVFRYKLSKLIAYSDLTDGPLNIHLVRYRRKMLIEDNINDIIPIWVMTSYSCDYINGTRNLQYTITLDLANNIKILGSGLKDGIIPRNFGDVL